MDILVPPSLSLHLDEGHHFYCKPLSRPFALASMDSAIVSFAEQLLDVKVWLLGFRTFGYALMQHFTSVRQQECVMHFVRVQLICTVTIFIRALQVSKSIL